MSFSTSREDRDQLRQSIIYSVETLLNDWFDRMEVEVDSATKKIFMLGVLGGVLGGGITSIVIYLIVK